MLVSETNDQDLPDPRDPELREHGAVGFIVLSEDAEEWKTLIRGSTSFSCAVGSPGWLANYLDVLPSVRREERPTLYACENNHKAVRELKVRRARSAPKAGRKLGGWRWEGKSGP